VTDAAWETGSTGRFANLPPWSIDLASIELVVETAGELVAQSPGPGRNATADRIGRKTRAFQSRFFCKGGISRESNLVSPSLRIAEQGM
jgi:hypothetical protein